MFRGGVCRLKRIDPLPLEKWPLFERSRLFELGCVFNCEPDELTNLAIQRVLGRNSGGWWECDLADNRLTWTAGVYDIFGLPQAGLVSRDEALGLYCEESRAVMERLRSYSIDNCCAFVVDAQIRPATGEGTRWMRLVGAPVLLDRHCTHLHGLKLIL